MKHLPLILLFITAVFTTGCGTFRRANGIAPGMPDLAPSRHPIAIANQMTTSLQADVFYDESRAYKLHVAPCDWINPKAQEIADQLRRKLSDLPNVTFCEAAAATHILRTEIPMDEVPKVAIYSLRLPTGKLVWSHREQLQKEKPL